MSSEDGRARGRPSNEIERDGSARKEIAFWLSEWRKRHSGRPTEIAIATGLSRGTVARRLSGATFIEPQIVSYVLRATNADEGEQQDWTALYATLSALHAEQEQGQTTSGVLPPAPPWAAAQDETPDESSPDESSPDESSPGGAGPGVAGPEVTLPARTAESHRAGQGHDASRWWSRTTSRVALLGVVVAVAAAAGLVVYGLRPAPGLTRPITVQNKVALGTDGLQEDKTPAYLSTVARPYCADEAQSCKVPGSEMTSGALINADCVVYTDVVMVNYNLRDAAAAGNPDAARSRLWYHGTRDGRSGYLSEVYVKQPDRGGDGLPICDDP